MAILSTTTFVQSPIIFFLRDGRTDARRSDARMEKGAAVVLIDS
jgi:hypothetical protein